MALNRTKVLEAAQKYLQKGQHDKAIAEYQKLVKEDPRDVRTLLKIGDLHTRRGSTPEAIETYGQVAEQYAKQGFFLKAVAVYKQILKLNPDQLDICEKLAGMYEELALVSDALKTYEAVSDGYARAGQIDRSLETMQKMIDLDPDNIAVRIKYAEALSKAERADDAAEAFAAGAALLKDQGRMDDYIRVAERQLYHQPTNVALSKELSNLYLERKDAKRALAKLQLCFKNDPRDIQTLEMLAEAFKQLGQGSKTISVLREIARIHLELGAEEPRKRALSRILDLDPDDQEAREALDTSERSKNRKFGETMIDGRSPEERAEDAAARAADLEEEDDDAELLVDGDDDDILIVEDEPKPSLKPAKPERAPETKEQRIMRLIGEADAQAAAGYWLEVEGLLEEVLELNPDEIPARERLKDLYLQLDREDDAVTQLLLLADACAETDVARAIGYMEHAVRIAPHDPRPKLRLQALDAEQEEPLSSADDASADAAAVDEAMDLLEQPIAPDEFESAPPPKPSLTPMDADLDALLDAPIEDDFGAPPAAATPAGFPPAREGNFPGGSNTMASLPRVSDVDDLLDDAIQSEPPVVAAKPQFDDALDAPIEDDFGAPPPKRESAGQPADAMALLDAPIEDDFGAPPAKPPSAPPMSMLDAPIEDDFGPEDAGPTAQGVDEAGPTSQQVDDAGPTVHHPDPLEADFDDFGLADPRFEESDVVQADMLRSERPSEIQTMQGDQAAPLKDEVTAESEVPPNLLAEEARRASEVPGPPGLGELDEGDEEDIPLLDSEPPRAPGGESVTVVPGPADEVAEAAEESFEGVAPADEAPAQAEAEAPVEAEETNPEIEETIDEAEFFFQQDMADEAIEAIQEALLIYPDNAQLLAKLAEFEKVADAQEAAAEAEPEGPDESFKLAEQLAEQLGEIPEEAPVEAIDVEQVFEQFKKGVAEQVSADDSATHFDLGIAYKEMGLVDDAMNEFRVAASDPGRECMARTMIGLCLMEQGNAATAIEELRAALACKQKDSRAELGLHYEIGTALQMLGNLPEALKEFQRVADIDGGFRDVKKKIEEIRAQVPDAGNGDNEDDFDKAFDDLLSDD